MGESDPHGLTTRDVVEELQLLAKAGGLAKSEAPRLGAGGQRLLRVAAERLERLDETRKHDERGRTERELKLDPAGYPTDEALARLSGWEPTDPEGALAAARKLWRWADDYWRQDGRRHVLVTGGWSGNESVVAALRRNYVLWSLLWVSSHRGGKHVLEVPDRYASESGKIETR